MPFEKKHVGDMSTSRGQSDIPITKASQSTAAEPLANQVQSIPKNEIEGRFYEISEDELLLDASVEARPLFTNEAYKIKPKDKHYCFLWGNFKAGQGLRYNQLIAMGFQNASEDDLLPKEQGGHQAQVDGGKLILGDVMLVKMQRNKYLSHVKYNLLKSNGMLTPQKIHEQAKSMAGSITTGNHGMPTMDKHKGEFFISSSGEVRDVAVATSSVEQRVFETVTRE